MMALQQLEMRTREDGCQKGMQLKDNGCNCSADQQCPKCCAVSENKDLQISTVAGNQRGVKCDICQKFFYKNSNLKVHIKTVHEKIRSFKCSECPKALVSKSGLQKHLQVIHKKAMEQVSNPCTTDCDPTDKKTGSGRRKSVKCRKCLKSFSRNSSLGQHLKVVHEKIKDFKCTKCSKEFGGKGTLVRHTKNVHDKIREFQCSRCDMTFGQKSFPHKILVPNVKIRIGTKVLAPKFRFTTFFMLTDMI